MSTERTFKLRGDIQCAFGGHAHCTVMTSNFINHRCVCREQYHYQNPILRKTDKIPQVQKYPQIQYFNQKEVGAVANIIVNAIVMVRVATFSEYFILRTTTTSRSSVCARLSIQGNIHITLGMRECNMNWKRTAMRNMS